MATQTFDTAPSNASDALFRAWGLALHTAIAAILTYVSQTGEIDFTTVVTPASTSQFKGFRMYRMNDASQATAPFFMRVDFGSGPSVATHPSVKFTFGNGIDGSGNFLSGSGYGSTTAKIIVFTGVNASVYRSYLSGDAGSLRFLLWPQIATASTSVPFLNIERQKSSAGADVSDGVLITLVGGVGWTGMQGIFTKEGIWLDASDTSSFMSPIRTTATASLFGLKVGIFPLHFFKGPLVPPPIGVLFYFTAEIPVTTWPTTVSITIYGVAHTYLVCGTSLYALRVGSSAVHSFLMRYE